MWRCRECVCTKEALTAECPDSAAGYNWTLQHCSDVSPLCCRGDKRRNKGKYWVSYKLVYKLKKANIFISTMSPDISKTLQIFFLGHSLLFQETGTRSPHYFIPPKVKSDFDVVCCFIDCLQSQELCFWK